VQIPMVISGQRQRRERAKELLDTVGLSHRVNNRLNQLSGGEQQRVAIAIALANNPALLLADEPTGAVDSKTADMILDIMRNVNRQMGVTVIIVTHDMNLSKKVDRIVSIRDGRTSAEFVRRTSYTEELKHLAELDSARAAEEDSHVELAVVDASGRLQIPRDYLDAMGIKGKSRLRVEMEDNGVIVYNPAATAEEQQENEHE